jgi:hypothetical protein
MRAVVDLTDLKWRGGLKLARRPSRDEFIH